MRDLYEVLYTDNFNQVDSYGQTPLHIASYRGMVDLVKYLIEQKVDLDVKDITGQTPLHLAASMDRVEVCRLLVQAGAEPHIPDDNGMKPWFWAEQNGNEKLRVDLGGDIRFTIR